MSACQLRQSSLIYRRTLSAAIFALVTFQTYSAHASPSVRVVATLPQAAGAVTQHLSGDALPVGAKYRIVVSPVSAISITIEALLESGRRDRLFSADRVTANRSIVLPQDGGWYAAQATSSDVRVLVTQGNVVTEHLIRTIDSSPSAGSPSLKGWAEQTKGSGQAGAGSSIEGDFDEVYERAALYRSAAIKLALAKEPIIRSGPGVTIFRSAAPAVVLIRTDKSTGSGVVISQRGEVLTNWHVLDGAKFIAIITKPPAGQRLNPGDVYEARLLKYDQIADLALIQFQRTPPNLALLRTADERSIEVGSSVHAIGHPDGQQWTYTQGVISQVRSDFRWKGNNDLQHSATVIQTQTPINPGSSGGPLLDDKVAVVGVNTFFRAEKQGLNFAISVGEIKRFIEMRDNREGTTHERKAESPRDTERCNQKDHRQFPPLQDPITKKKVVPFDTLCLGRPNFWRVGDPPEYVLWDRVGDGKIDVKIVYKFAPDVDLWIVYGMRDEVPTMFGYDYGRKGKPERWVTVNPPHQ
jgi:S1-C subfamily serine protease